MAQCFGGLIKMFKDIEHRDQRIASPGLETLIERLPRNSLGKRSGGIDDRVIGFDAFGLAERFERGKEQRIATPHIQDRSTAAQRQALF